MREVRIEKVTVNIGVGEAGDQLQKAEDVLTQVTGAQPVRTRARRSSREWGVREGQEIGVKVTLRDEQAAEFLKKCFYVRNDILPDYSFDDGGNLSFGIADHTDFKDMKYNPDVGVFGMDVAVTLSRPGSRVRRRRIRPKTVPNNHRVSRQEAIEFIKDTFGIEVEVF